MQKHRQMLLIEAGEPSLIALSRIVLHFFTDRKDLKTKNAGRLAERSGVLDKAMGEGYPKARVNSERRHRVWLLCVLLQPL